MIQKKHEQLFFCLSNDYFNSVRHESQTFWEKRDLIQKQLFYFPLSVWNPLLNGRGCFTKVDNRCFGVSDVKLRYPRLFLLGFDYNTLCYTLHHTHPSFDSNISLFLIKCHHSRSKTAKCLVSFNPWKKSPPVSSGKLRLRQVSIRSTKDCVTVKTPVKTCLHRYKYWEFTTGTIQWPSKTPGLHPAE